MVTAARDLENHLRALPVKLFLSTEADADFVKSTGPDAVILATGARPSVPDIEGLGKDRVVTAWDVLSGKVGTGTRVVIVGGNAVGLETALYLASQGTIPPEVLHFLITHKAESMETIETLLNKGNKEVHVVEMTKKAGQDIGSSTRWTVMAELRRLGVEILTGARAVEFAEAGVVVEKEQGRHHLPADTVVIAAGSTSENSLADELKGLVREIHVIGDAQSPRNALEAIREGFLVGLRV